MWLSIFITETKNIKYLLRRIELTPEALELVWVFRVVMKWGWDPDVPHDWKLCGPPEDWFFEDRRDKKEECLKMNAVPEVFWQWPNLPFDDWNALPDDRPPLPGPSEMNDWDPEHFENWWKKQPPLQWTSGSQGEGRDPVVKNARTFRALMEPLLEKMSNLHTFHWYTEVIPLSARMCRALARARSLQVVWMSPSGEFLCSSEYLCLSATHCMLPAFHLRSKLSRRALCG